MEVSKIIHKQCSKTKLGQKVLTNWISAMKKRTPKGISESGADTTANHSYFVKSALLVLNCEVQ